MDSSLTDNIGEVSAQSSNPSRMEDIVIPPQLKFLMANMKSMVSTQLTTENYPTWKAQIFKLFKANGCNGYLDGSNPKPSSQVLNNDGSVTPNPQYNTWMLVDQSLVAALYFSPVEAIEKNESRLVCFSKRHSSIFKKATELSILSDAKIRVIVFSPAIKL